MSDAKNTTLFVTRAQLTEQKKEIEAELKSINNELHARFYDAALEKLRSTGAETGTVTLTDADGVEVKVTIAKKVDWDEEGLKAAIDVITDATNINPHDIVERKLNVSEKTYSQMEIPVVREALSKARTVGQGAVKIEQVQPKGGAQ